MNETIFANAGYVIALAACFTGAYLWKRAKLLASELEALQAETNIANAALASKAHLETLLATKDSELQKKDRELGDFAKTRASVVKEHTEIQKALQERSRTVENQLEHYKEQTEALLAQVRELDAENSVLKRTMEKDLQEKTSELAKNVESLRFENRKLQDGHSQFDSHSRTLQDRLAAIQSEFKEQVELMSRIKRKAYQSDHLYRTIRGQKEMLEERLENWEKALRLLSLWVLRLQNQTMSADASLGQIVSAALQSSQQGPLVCDDVEIAMNGMQEVSKDNALEVPPSVGMTTSAPPEATVEGAVSV